MSGPQIDFDAPYSDEELAAMSAWDFKPSDFSVEGLDVKELAHWGNIPLRWKNQNIFWAGGRSRDYEVTHDLVTGVTHCQCIGWYHGHPCRHAMRVQLVLALRADRRKKAKAAQEKRQADDDRRSTAQVNGDGTGHAFSILR